MAAVHSVPLASSLHPLLSSVPATKLATPVVGVYPSGTSTPIIDAEQIKKAIFKTSYEPSEKLWADNQAAYVKPADDPLPEGFPAEAVGPHVWEGKDLAETPGLWLHIFTPDEVAEVEEAIEHFRSLDLPFSAIGQENFPLIILKPVLHQAVIDIHQGRGFRLLRGLPVAKWDRKAQIIAFTGISSYIGAERFRQPGGTAIHHLRDITSLDPAIRPAIVVKGQTSGNQVFHTDQCGDILGLFVLDRAETGGLSQLSSVGATYNDLAESRRDILRTLASGDWKSRYETKPRPLLYHVDGRVVAAYSRRPYFPFFEDQSAAKEAPAITREQHLALDALHFTAESHAINIEIEPGDLSYFNDFLLFHARTASEDSASHTRHLLRIYLRNEEHALDHGRALDERWASLKVAETEELRWPLEAWSKE